jgi:hypothetical protein
VLQKPTTFMADGAAPSAAPRRLLELLARADELSNKKRTEPAVAKLQEAVALARETTPPQSLLRAYALVRHAERAVAQQTQLLARSITGTGVDRASYAAEQALCAAAYASLREALPILFARAEANTLLPGIVPADEEESYLQLLLEAAHKGHSDNSATAMAARTADLRGSRRGQCLGYTVFLQAAFCSLLVLYPAQLNNPFPLRADDEQKQHENGMLSACIMQAVRWLGASLDGSQYDARNAVQWRHLGGLEGLLDGTKLCGLISVFLAGAQSRPQLFSPTDDFRRTLNELWHSPQLANRRRMWDETVPALPCMAEDSIKRVAADIARRGLATCTRAGCGAVESCPKAFKRCSRCHSVVYCSRDCQLAAWPSHKRDCKRTVAECEAGAPSSAADD